MNSQPQYINNKHIISHNLKKGKVMKYINNKFNRQLKSDLLDWLSAAGFVVFILSSFTFMLVH